MQNRHQDNGFIKMIVYKTRHQGLIICPAHMIILTNGIKFHRQIRSIELLYAP